MTKLLPPSPTKREFALNSIQHEEIALEEGQLNLKGRYLELVNTFDSNSNEILVPREGIEPTRHCWQRILSSSAIVQQGFYTTTNVHRLDRG